MELNIPRPEPNRSLAEKVLWGILRFAMGTFNWGLKLAGPVFVCIAWGLIGTVLHQLWRNIIPYSSPSPWVRGVHSINAFIFGWNILWNYAMAITNQAGGVKIVSVSKPGVPVTAKDGLWGAGDQASLPPGFGWCRHCNGPKPPRAHHCSVCGTCVLKMDHHCPWMANCVGQRNHRYFVLFLIWLMIGCIYLAGTASLMLKYNDAVTIPRSVRQSTTFCMVLASSAGLSVGILGIWHVYLAATAQTTIDFQTNRMAKERATLKGEVWSNPYDLGYINNWNRFFNVSTPLMAFWPSLTPLDDDGVSWMTREDLARRTMAKHTPSYIA